MKYDFGIIGAGIYGCSLARLLSEKGYKILLVEKDANIGGLCRTIKEEDYFIHYYGAHIFHTNSDEVWNFVNLFANFKRYINSPKAVYHKKFYSLPFNMNTFYEIYGSKTEEEARQAIEKDIIKYDKIDNLEQQAISMVGTKIYSILVKDYTEKQWGKSCKELSSDIIKRLPLRFTFDNDYFNDKYEAIPESGYSNMMMNMITHKNITYVSNVDYFCHRQKIEDSCNKIVFCGSIDKFFNYRYGHLEYRSLKFEHIKYNKSNVQCTAVLNYTDKEVDYTRSIEHKHFTKDSKSTTSIVSYEHSCQYDGTNLQCYPMTDEKNLKLYKKYLSLKDDRHFFGGRIGKYKYLDMDKAILEAFKDAKELI